jgi:membrane protease YdiL (CAAX protease family)
MNSGRRAAALLEVFGVYLTGVLLPVVIVKLLLGFEVPNPLGHFTANISDAQLLTATRQMFVVLVLQYAGYFVLIIPINWWHRRRGPAAYGITRSGRSWKALLLAGAATAAIASWPFLAVNLAHMVWKFGKAVPWRQAFFDTSWRRWEFWLFSAVLLFAVVPVLDELFYRGYCQRRLAEDWGDGPAIAGASCLFAFSHSQYLIPDGYNVGMVVTLLVGAVGFGVVFAWTRSLLPSIIAHAIVNFPLRATWLSILLAVLMIAAVVTASRGAAATRQVFSNARIATMLALGLIGAAYSIAGARIHALAFAAVGMLLVAVALEARQKRGERLANNSAATT